MGVLAAHAFILPVQVFFFFLTDLREVRVKTHEWAPGGDGAM